MKRFGLIGYPVSHSYSKKFFSEKFRHLGLMDHLYELYEMKSIDSFPNLWDSNADLVGVNVTVPHKQAVNKYLQHLDASAENVGATNVVVRRDNELIGYNTDYLAFKHSLECWLDG
ncbi:MAG: shikimate dehydrogenase, partial [Ekhidna sp.]|nr:shikimate dehydrogenase [Ekhidna sp.]